MYSVRSTNIPGLRITNSKYSYLLTTAADTRQLNLIRSSSGSDRKASLPRGFQLQEVEMPVVWATVSWGEVGEVG